MSVDPVELELTRNFLEAAAEEMGVTLQRSAFSANIKERRDFSCAIFDADGILLAQAAHIPVHLGSMPASVSAVRETLGDLNDGDVAVVNDPFAGGSHLPDITIVSPVFFENERIGYVANRAHHADVGGTSPGSMTLSRHIDEEGVRIEPTLLLRRDERQSTVFDRLMKAVRTPDERAGDLAAQLAANRTGAAAMNRLVLSSGVVSLKQNTAALLDYADGFMTRLLAGMPSGEWRFEDALDDDGAGGGPVAIRVALRIDAARATLDFAASADQAAGCVNCPAAVTRSAVYYCFACLLEPGAPLNAGSFRRIDVRTRPGSVLDAQFPAAVVAGNTETSQRVVDVTLGALAAALPGRIPAASCGTMSSVALGGTGWTYYETIGGGSGAGPSFDGASAVQCHMTNTLNTPSEALEMQYPMRVRRFERAKSTGGVGSHCGGEGVVRVLEALAPCEGTLLADRRVTRPYSLAGGEAGASAADRIVRLDGEVVALRGKTKFELQAGDRIEIRTPGGGGWGAADRR